MADRGVVMGNFARGCGLFGGQWAAGGVWVWCRPGIDDRRRAGIFAHGLNRYDRLGNTQYLPKRRDTVS